MSYDDAITIAPLAYPLTFLLGMLIIARKAESTFNPIVVKVVNGLADNAGSNALTYGLMIGYGMSAALSALAEQADKLGWVVIAAMAKVVNPFLIGMLAFAAKNNFGNPPSKPSNPSA